jgi:hypothetical protein
MKKMTCGVCKRVRELRSGICFDCAWNMERILAKRYWFEHVWIGLRKIHRPELWWQIGHDWSLAFQRLTETGSYAPGGKFDRLGYGWKVRQWKETK